MVRSAPWTILAGGVSVGEVLWWVAGFGLFVLLAALVLYWTKRMRVRYEQQDIQADSRLEIEDIERMYRSGLISKDEFETLRRTALGLADAQGEKADSPLSSRGKVDDENTGREDIGPPDAEDQK